MRCEVCYTTQRMVFHTINRLNALKEGFNVRNGNSLKAFGSPAEDTLSFGGRVG